MSWQRCPARPDCVCSVGGDDRGEAEWGFAELVACICLRDRDDRFAESCDEFHRVGLCSRVWYYRAIPPTQAQFDRWQEAHPGAKLSLGGFGCWTSHQAVNARALQLGAKRVLVLEDDVSFRSGSEEVVRLGEDLDRHPDWDVWHLGWFPFTGRPLCWDLGVWKVRSVCTVAYIASVSGMTKIVGADVDQSVDFWIMNHCAQYASFPKLAWQRDSPSSIEEVWSIGAGDNIKRWANDLYRSSTTAFDVLILIIIPLVLALLLCFFFTLAIKMLRSRITGPRDVHAFDI